MRSSVVVFLAVVLIVFGSMAVLATVDMAPQQQKVSLRVPDSSLPR